MRIGITERGDGGLDQSWRSKLDIVDGIIIITKAPHLIENIPDNAIIHCTITGNGGTWIEPNVIPTDIALEHYSRLVSMYGGERVVLRIDPIIPYSNMSLSNAYMVNSHAKGRVRISFIDMYSHVKDRFRPHIPHIDNYTFHAPLEERLRIWNDFGRPEICGEPGMSCSGCISEQDVILMGLNHLNLKGNKSGQRKTCLCIAEKTELLENKSRCNHSCLYCYWR